MSITNKLNDKTWMTEQYVVQQRSLQDIADELETNRQRVRRALVRLEIPRRTKSEAQKVAIEAGRSEHPTEGKPRSDEVRMRIAEGVHRDWANADEETLQKRAEKSREIWNKKTPEEKAELLKMAQDAVRVAAKEGSKLERFLRDSLTKAGYKVKYHVNGVIPNVNLEVDLMVPALSTAIEIDGPSHFLPIWGDDSLQKNIKSDLEKTGLLLAQGYVVIRVKQLSHHISKLVQHQLFTKVVEALEKVKGGFPAKNDRLIELEI